jgi:hypothetical protein
VGTSWYRNRKLTPCESCGKEIRNYPAETSWYWHRNLPPLKPRRLDIGNRFEKISIHCMCTATAAQGNMLRSYTPPYFPSWNQIVASFLTSCLDMYIVQPLDIVNLVLVPRIEIRVNLEAWDLLVFGWTCWISENFNGKGPNFKEMGARVCLRFAVISDTVSSWNMH